MQLDARWSGLLAAVAHGLPAELFYALELRVLVAENLGEFDPVLDQVRIVKRLHQSDLDGLQQWLHPFGPHVPDSINGPLLVIVGSFARNEILLGPRGYRRTLLEAGQVAQVAVHAADRLDLRLRAVYEFIDRDLDRLMEADGVEQGTVLVLEMGVGQDAGVAVA